MVEALAVAALAVAAIGHSVQGRPIEATAEGSGRTVLVVGCIHGDECAGLRVARRLARAPAPEGMRLVVVPQLNPDGHRRRTRTNARGVDLNRNFPSGWRPSGRGPIWSGPRPFSEPETRAVRRLVTRERPEVTVWLHQQFGGALVRAWGRSVPAARRYARVARLPFRRLRWSPGGAPRWQNLSRRSISFVVEMPKGRGYTETEVRRHLRAVRALGSRNP